MFRIKRSRILSIFIVFLYGLLFYFSSKGIFQKLFFLEGYNLFSETKFSFYLYFLLIAISISFFLPLNSRPSSIILWSVYLMHVFPTIVLAPSFVYFNDFLFLFLVLITVTYILIAKIVSSVSLNLRIYNFLSIKGLKKINLILISFLLIVVFLIFKEHGFTFKLIEWQDIYTIRSDFKSLDKSPFLAYFILMAGFTLVPLALSLSVYFLLNKKKHVLGFFLLLIALLTQIQIFMIAAFKSVLAVVLTGVLLGVVLDKFKKPILVFLNSIFILSLVFYIIFSLKIFEIPLLHIFRRVFITPGINVILYFNEFGFNTFNMAKDAPLHISLVYYGTEGSANSGLFGNGLALAGVLGIILNSFILLMYCLMLDSFSKNLPLTIIFPTSLSMGYVFSNSATSTVMVSYGGILLLFFYFMLSKTFVIKGDFNVKV